MIQQHCSPEANVSRLPGSDFIEIKYDSEAKKKNCVS